MKEKRLAVLGGAGKIGSAIVSALLESETVSASQVTVTARHDDHLEPARQKGLNATTNNVEAVKNADLVLLCVHPEDTQELLEEVAPHLTTKHLIISVVSGCSTKQIEGFCHEPLRVIRAMPNTPVRVRQSMTCLAIGKHAQPEDMEMAKRIFATVGEIEELDERHMDAATGLGGCGPAFAFKIIEALSEGGVKMGLPRTTSRKMAAQVLKGAAELVLLSGEHPAALKDAVTTPGGCTVDGLAKLEERGLSIALIDAVETSTKKAKRLLP